MSHGHGHGGAAAPGGRAVHRRRLTAAFLLTLAVLVVEVAAGLATNSLALLSDAAHVLTDVLGMGMALAAITLATRARAHPQRSFGLYRLEILAALANAVLLVGIAGYVCWEAVARLREPAEVLAGPMLAVAVLGLAANVGAFLLLRRAPARALPCGRPISRWSPTPWPPSA